MKKEYEVAIPITGYQIYVVQASSEEEAKQIILQGDIDTCDYDDIEHDLDSNNWLIQPWKE